MIGSSWDQRKDAIERVAALVQVPTIVDGEPYGLSSFRTDLTRLQDAAAWPMNLATRTYYSHLVEAMSRYATRNHEPDRKELGIKFARMLLSRWNDCWNQAGQPMTDWGQCYMALHGLVHQVLVPVPSFLQGAAHGANLRAEEPFNHIAHSEQLVPHFLGDTREEGQWVASLMLTSLITVAYS